MQEGEFSRAFLRHLRNAKTIPPKRNDRNYRNDQNKITKPPKQNNKTTETSNVIHRSFVSVICGYVRFGRFVWMDSVVSMVSF